MLSLIYRFITLTIACLVVISCGGGGGAEGGAGGDGSASSQAEPKIAVVGDEAGTKLSTFLSTQGYNVDNIQGIEYTIGHAMNDQYAVWLKIYFDNNGSQYHKVQLYDITTRTLSVVPVPDSQKSQLTINDRYIAWRETKSGMNNIVLYEIDSGLMLTISSYSSAINPQYHVNLYSDYLLWVEPGPVGNDELYIYHFSTDTTDFVAPVTEESFDENVYDADGDYVVYENNGDIHLYRISTGINITLISDANRQFKPVISGSYVAWNSLSAGGNNDIHVYDITTGIIDTSTVPGEQTDPQIQGEYLVYRNNEDLLAFSLTSRTALPVRLNAPGRFIRYGSHRISGDYIYWRESNSSFTPRVRAYSYYIPTGVVTFMSEGFTQNPSLYAVSNSRVLLGEWPNTGYNRVLLNDVTSPGAVQISAIPAAIAAIDNVTGYDMIVFAGGSGELTLDLFNAADSANISVLSIGTQAYEPPLVDSSEFRNKFGIIDVSASMTALIAVDVDPTRLEHPIFDGVDTSTTLQFELPGATIMDEYSFESDTTNPNARLDWTVLARYGAANRLAGDASIVEFTTDNGTRVILDGSANDGDQYLYWSNDRWTVFANEVRYLMQ